MGITIELLEKRINERALKIFAGVLHGARQAITDAIAAVTGKGDFTPTDALVAVAKEILEHGLDKDAATKFPDLFRKTRDRVVEDFLGATEAVRALADGREFE